MRQPSRVHSRTGPGSRAPVHRLHRIGPGRAATGPLPINARPVLAETRRVRSLARPGIGAHHFEPGGELEREWLPGEEEIRESRAQLAGVEAVGAVTWSRRPMSAHSAHTDAGTSPNRISSPNSLQPRQ